jgi:hypothetical protein
VIGKGQFIEQGRKRGRREEKLENETKQEAIRGARKVKERACQGCKREDFFFFFHKVWE